MLEIVIVLLMIDMMNSVGTGVYIAFSHSPSSMSDRGAHANYLREKRIIVANLQSEKT